MIFYHCTYTPILIGNVNSKSKSKLQRIPEVLLPNIHLGSIPKVPKIILLFPSETKSEFRIPKSRAIHLRRLVEACLNTHHPWFQPMGSILTMDVRLAMALHITKRITVPLQDYTLSCIQSF